MIIILNQKYQKYIKKREIFKTKILLEIFKIYIFIYLVVYSSKHFSLITSNLFFKFFVFHSCPQLITVEFWKVWTVEKLHISTFYPI